MAGAKDPAAAARTYTDVGSEFKIPKLSPEERRALSKEQWLEQYGEVPCSEEHFEKQAPRWNYNPDSWWFRSVGRAGGEAPLWMRAEYHLPELDCPPGRDRAAGDTLDARRQRGDVPLWAQRMNLSGSKQGEQSATVYGHRAEYRPSEKTAARSMGVSTNPYEKRLVISARRKPIVIGPRTAAVVVDGEMHTLGNAYAEVGWLHPAMELAAYSIEHPVYRHVNLRAQTKASSGVSGEQAMAETLELSQQLFGVVGEGMEAAMRCCGYDRPDGITPPGFFNEEDGGEGEEGWEDGGEDKEGWEEGEDEERGDDGAGEEEWEDDGHEEVGLEAEGDGGDRVAIMEAVMEQVRASEGEREEAVRRQQEEQARRQAAAAAAAQQQQQAKLQAAAPAAAQQAAAPKQAAAQRRRAEEVAAVRAKRQPLEQELVQLHTAPQPQAAAAAAGLNLTAAAANSAAAGQLMTDRLSSCPSPAWAACCRRWGSRHSRSRRAWAAVREGTVVRTGGRRHGDARGGRRVCGAGGWRISANLQ
eukprot:scaffold6.g2611.t1